MSEKITGYLLLFLGLLVIGVSSFNLYQVFTKKLSPVQFFTGPGISVSVPGTTTQQEVIPAQTLNDASNLTLHYLLVTFLVSVGFKVSSLGIQLLRPIEVKLTAKPQ